MAKEIERKFLLKQKPAEADVLGMSTIVQGYLIPEGKVTMRVRIEKAVKPYQDEFFGEETAYFTLKDHAKGKKSDGTDEEEMEIAVYMAKRLLKECGDRVIKKDRYDVIYGHSDNRLVWEVDIFKRNLKGLCVAEIEIAHADQKIIIPKWLGEEVTNDKRYKNKNLSLVQRIPDGYVKPRGVADE